MKSLTAMSLKLIRIARLKQFVTQRKLERPAEIGRAIGKKANQASDLLNGKAAFGEKVARSIEVAAKLPENWLDNLGDEQNTEIGPALRGAVPILSSAEAGMYKQHIDNYNSRNDGRETVPTSAPINRHTFALRVLGDSMEPEFPAGTTLIIEPDIEAEAGDYVLARSGGDEPTFKQLVKDGADWYLKPQNTRYPIKPLGTHVIIGVLMAVEKRYKIA